MIPKILFRAVVAALAYLGFFTDVAGARNVLYFVVWLAATALLLASKVDAKPKEPDLPLRLTAWIDAAITAALVWQGAWLAWVPWVTYSLIYHGVALKSRELFRGARA